jgi:hypothetical protein
VSGRTYAPEECRSPPEWSVGLSVAYVYFTSSHDAAGSVNEGGESVDCGVEESDR